MRYVRGIILFAVAIGMIFDAYMKSQIFTGMGIGLILIFGIEEITK